MWFENNPLGVGIAAACGVLVLTSVALVVVWGRPASSGLADAPADTTAMVAQAQSQSELEPLSAYRIVTERPVFDESRRPVVIVEGEGMEVVSEESSEVGERPEVRPTGIVITPEMRMVTLKPDAGGDTILAIEGRPLEGDYVGWIVSDIKPREVTLASLDGDVIKLGLEVNTRKIAEPPKPPPRAEQAGAAAQAAANGGDGSGAGEDEPLTRAEQIRQRIAERREELRRQAEEGEQANQSGAARPSQYQSAIRNMIKNRNENDDDKENDGGDGNGG